MLHDPFRFQRKSIRYKGWDYRTPAYYFVTLCAFQRQHLFENAQFEEIVTKAWDKIQRIPHVSLDERVVMPNHKHGIIQILRFPSPTQTEPEPQVDFHNAPAGSIGAIIGGFKGTTTEQVNRLRDGQGNKIWQRGNWDRIIRNERELNAIRQYIRDNPRRWAEDRDNLDTLINTRMTYHPS